MNFYKRYMADYAKKTSRLNLMQHGAYTLLLDEVYASEAALPADMGELYRICRAMTGAERDAVKLVADRFFPVGNDGLRHNNRAIEELIEAAPAVEAARANGKKGGRPPKQQPNGDELNNPLGFQNKTQDEPNSKAPHSSDIQLPKGSLSPDKPATCPHQKIIELFGKHLPTLPQPKPELWSGQRANDLRMRWKWLMTATKKSGERYATTEAEGLDFFDRFFSYVAGSDFLSGRNGKWTACDLGWLVKSENFVKVMQGNYDNKGAA